MGTSAGTASGGTGNRCTTDKFKATRLVAKTVRSGQAPSRSATAGGGGRDLLEVFRVLECDTKLPAECAVMRVIHNESPPADNPARILIARNGTETIVEQSAAPLVNDNGDIAGVVLVFRRRTSR